MKITIKKFLEWIKIKEHLHNNVSTPPLFKEGEIWWCGIGENIGVEINGKSKDFTRPVLIFKKLSREGFMGIPMSTQSKEGSWYVSVKQKNAQAIIILSQMRVFSSNRLHTKLGELDDEDCKAVSAGFAKLYLSSKKFPPPFLWSGVVGKSQI